MSPELPYRPHFTDHKDSYLYMMMRRRINEDYAEHAVDFNAEGLLAGELIAGRSLTDEDIVVDVGSSSGVMIADAAEKTGIQARIICVEPDREAAEAYLHRQDVQPDNLLFIRAAGEALPFADESVLGASLHNVIFRAKDAQLMLHELQRVIMPGGHIAISTNARNHAPYRHRFEAEIAKAVIRETGVHFKVPKPPADGYYLEDMPALLSQVQGLQVIDNLYVPQASRTIITPGERMTDYLDSLKYSAANTNIPPKLRSVWRRVVETVVGPLLTEHMAHSQEDDEQLFQQIGPFFADPIHRGMFVLRKTDSTH